VTRHERELAGFLPGDQQQQQQHQQQQLQLLPPSHLDRNLASMLASRGAAKQLADSRSTGRLATHRSVLPALLNFQYFSVFYLFKSDQ
jgi:hypothetical protein